MTAEQSRFGLILRRLSLVRRVEGESTVAEFEEGEKLVPAVVEGATEHPWKEISFRAGLVSKIPQGRMVITDGRDDFWCIPYQYTAGLNFENFATESFEINIYPFPFSTNFCDQAEIFGLTKRAIILGDGRMFVRKSELRDGEYMRCLPEIAKQAAEHLIKERVEKI